MEIVLFIFVEVINNMVPALVAGDAQFVTAKAKYCSLHSWRRYRVISASALSELSTKAPYQFRKSITGYIFEAGNRLSFKYTTAKLKTFKSLSKVDLTVDTSEDLGMLELFGKLYVKTAG